MQDGASFLRDDPSGDTCTSFCHKENKKEKDNTYASTTEGVGAKQCPGPPRAYETPLSINREKTQKFGEYLTLKH